MSRPTSLEAVREVLARHKENILAKYDPAGVGIGKDDPASAAYVIVVYLKTRERLPTEKVEVEGVPLKFEVTGKFKLFR